MENKKDIQLDDIKRMKYLRCPGFHYQGYDNINKTCFFEKALKTPSKKRKMGKGEKRQADLTMYVRNMKPVHKLAQIIVQIDFP